MKKSIFKACFAALSCVAALVLTSCDPGGDDNKRYSQGYFTITGTYPNYKLIEDGGAVVYPSAYSVNELTNNKGFGNNKRAFFSFSYEDKDVTTTADNAIVQNAELVSGNYVTVVKPISLETAKEQNILVADSVFSVRAYSNCWINNGYFTTIFTAPVSYASVTSSQFVHPTTNICVEADGISENSVTFNMLYNRHTKKDAISSDASLVYSFDIANINIPGSDSINVKLKAEGVKDVTFKVARNTFMRQY